MASRRNFRYHIVIFVCSRYIIAVCTSIRAISLYTEDEGERRWLPEGISGRYHIVMFPAAYMLFQSIQVPSLNTLVLLLTSVSK